MEKSEEYKALTKELFDVKVNIKFAIMAGNSDEVESLRLREKEIKKLLADEMIESIKEEKERGRR